MAGVPSGQGSVDDRYRNWFSERFPPISTAVLRIGKYDMDLLGEMLSGLSHLPMRERMEAFGKKLKEHSLSKAPSVDTSEDKDEDDEEEEEEEEDEVDEDENDREEVRLKLLDDEKKPLCAEEHLDSGCERERKKL